MLTDEGDDGGSEHLRNVGQLNVTTRRNFHKTDLHTRRRENLYLSLTTFIFPGILSLHLRLLEAGCTNNLQVNLDTARTPDSFTRAAERVFSVSLCLGKTLPTELARNTAVEMALEPCSDQLADFFLCRVVCRDLESLSPISLPSILTGIEFETPETSVWNQYYCFSPQYRSALKY
jgi:hypothetical protein